jgi:hypothetical protein
MYISTSARTRTYILGSERSTNLFTPQLPPEIILAALPIEAIEPLLIEAPTPLDVHLSTFSVADGSIPRPNFPTTRPIFSHMPPISASRRHQSPFDLGSRMDNLREMLGYCSMRFSPDSLGGSRCDPCQTLPFVVWFLVPSLRSPCYNLGVLLRDKVFGAIAPADSKS